MSDARPSVQRSGRLKRVLAFVAIVWLVAGSFVIFEVVAMRGFDLVLDTPSLHGSVMLSPATQQSTACVVQPGEAIPGPAPDLNANGARARAWMLGLQVGEYAQARQWSNPGTLGEYARDIARQSSELAVAAPAAFVPNQIANAHREFIAFVENDAAHTAHQIAVRYSPEACDLYKLGAFRGYSSLVRTLLPGERVEFAIEIRHYARRLSLPETLWEPMVEPAPRGATRAALFADIIKLNNGMTRHLAGGQP